MLGSLSSLPNHGLFGLRLLTQLSVHSGGLPTLQGYHLVALVEVIPIREGTNRKGANRKTRHELKTSQLQSSMLTMHRMKEYLLSFVLVLITILFNELVCGFGQYPFLIKYLL